MPRPSFSGIVLLGEGRGLYLGPVGDTTPHAHHALQIAVGLEGPLALSLRDREPEARPAWLVLPDDPHQLHPDPGPVALFFLEPESRPARALLRRWAGLGSGPLDAAPFRALRRTLALRPLTDPWPALMEALGVGPESAPAVDPRVLRVIAWLRTGAEPVPTLSEAARIATLSPSRLGHVFSESTGLPFKRYVLWLRLQRALRAMLDRGNLTTAAHEAGFSDSAHLSRTFRRMFGIAPSELMRPQRNPT